MQGASKEIGFWMRLWGIVPCREFFQKILRCPRNGGSMKRCSKCKQPKHRDEFGPDTSHKDGKSHRCRACDTKRVTAHNANHRKEKTKHTKLGRKRHPEKSRARLKLQAAIASSQMIRLPCRDCGATKTEAHHPDYSKPLEVIWLCSNSALAIRRLTGSHGSTAPEPLEDIASTLPRA